MTLRPSGLPGRLGFSLLFGLPLACGFGGAAPASAPSSPAAQATSPVPPPSSPVTAMRVQSVADFVTAQNRYLEMVGNAQSGTLRIVIAAGTYTGVLFQAIDPMTSSEVGVELAGEGDVRIDGNIVIEAPRVEVRGLAIQGQRPGFRLSIAATQAVTLADVSLAGGGADPRIRSGTLRVEARGPATTFDATNLALAPAARPVMELESLPGRDFAAVTVRGLTLGEVGGAPAVRLSTAGAVTLAEVSARTSVEPLIAVTRPPVRVTLERCHLAAPTRNGIVQPEVGPDGHPLQFAPTRLVDCAIDAPAEGDALPGVASG